ncbi:hypothetical protein Y032_0210g2147 [Ancylostoma ceylanicum]|uniref:Aldose 1-epimerase n=3 Tax=Ancylostoma TaxID=29169 RepID=A0A016SL98_9BILA|nr:hypothetical protein Y032_0210g2147 [Ancylostoma ceylanicum]
MRSVTIESFGETRDERRIVLIRITNGNGMRLELLNLGATVRSIVVPDREGVMTDVALGFDSVKAYEADPLYIGSTLGRVAGRIRDARYAIDSREYFLAQNDHPHHRNGGAKSPLSKKVWNYTLLEEGNGVVFNVRSHDGEEGYPGNANVQVSYVLTNHNEILVQFSANTDKSTLMNLSSNFYLNLDGEGSSLENHELQVTATSYLETEKDGAVTGEMIDLPSTSRDPQPLCRDRMGKFDHIYCFDPLQTKSAKKFRHMMRIFSNKSGIDLNVTSTLSCLRFDTGTELDGSTGKQGKTYKRHSAFVIGCRGFEDACNQTHFPPISLRPDQLYQHITIYRFSLVE